MTFDTRLATRSEWVEWLGTWFTPSPLYDDPRDALDQMAGYLVELDQAVVLPPERWDDLARKGGRVSAHVVSEVVYLDLPETTQKRKTLPSLRGRSVARSKTVRRLVSVAASLLLLMALGVGVPLVAVPAVGAGSSVVGGGAHWQRGEVKIGEGH